MYRLGLYYSPRLHLAHECDPLVWCRDLRGPDDAQDECNEALDDNYLYKFIAHSIEFNRLGALLFEVIKCKWGSAPDGSL